MNLKTFTAKVLPASLLGLMFALSPVVHAAPNPQQSRPAIAPQAGGESDEGVEGSDDGRKQFGSNQRTDDPFRHIDEHNEGGFEEIQLALVALAVALAALLAYRAGRRKTRKQEND